MESTHTAWQLKAFGELTVAELYQVLQLRQDVFILEQSCFYNDFDGLDQDAHHLLGWRTVEGRRLLAAYLRVLAPGAKYTEMSLGRVLTSKAARATGIGRELLAQGIAYAERLRAHGPTSFAFTFKQPFPAPDAPAIETAPFFGDACPAT